MSSIAEETQEEGGCRGQLRAKHVAGCSQKGQIRVAKDTKRHGAREEEGGRGLSYLLLSRQDRTGQLNCGRHRTDKLLLLLRRRRHWWCCSRSQHSVDSCHQSGTHTAFDRQDMLASLARQLIGRSVCTAEARGCCTATMSHETTRPNQSLVQIDASSDCDKVWCHDCSASM